MPGSDDGAGFSGPVRFLTGTGATAIMQPRNKVRRGGEVAEWLKAAAC